MVSCVLNSSGRSTTCVLRWTVTPVKNHKTIKIQMNAAAKFRWWAQKRETPAPKATIDARKFSIAPTGDAQLFPDNTNGLFTL